MQKVTCIGEQVSGFKGQVFFLFHVNSVDHIVLLLFQRL